MCAAIQGQEQRQHGESRVNGHVVGANNENNGSVQWQLIIEPSCFGNLTDADCGGRMPSESFFLM
jgi:hypothetical protein